MIVGVDGSDTSRRALDWALDEARPRQADVEVIHAWRPSFVSVATRADSANRFAALTRNVVATALERADASGPPVPVQVKVRTGSGASVLVEAAKDADLVVVGSRGLGSFKRLLLGSVSSHVAHHASCPVVVIPHARKTARGLVSEPAAASTTSGPGPA